ncbi:hypothetical protein [Cohnella thermotolerans]|nr:hypothetical protein [Cohnella thermotolerans]
MKVARKKREKSKYETKIPAMGRREIEQSKKALELLRSNRLFGERMK